MIWIFAPSLDEARPIVEELDLDNPAPGHEHHIVTPHSLVRGMSIIGTDKIYIVGEPEPYLWRLLEQAISPAGMPPEIVRRP